ncbi:transcriptional regulator [Actinorhabdospora filicis]|uniref:Transcriptional regulator n=1 Tax=Actinorhabdospora filicis TaxID=1785913 RepID=A0A9W6SPG4_9ACTN|nr:helix-turn-helix transcriptional regulator [Actinorhabdospora filicis]GLZ79707.1 transcriptional regulator [Actinorhabdospora filicis]
MLHGRAPELARLAALTSGALLLTGDAGAGKSALLDAAARPWRTLRATGVDAEAGLPYAALHQLLRPVAALTTALPGPQRDALAAAFGEAAGPADPFLTGAAVLSLLTEASEGEGGLLVIADDVQWFDPASAAALMFAVRRLAGEPVAFLLAARGGKPDWANRLDTLHIGGLDATASADLLTALAPVPPAGTVLAQLAELTGGNPLALTEAAGLLNTTQWTDREPLPDPLPVGADIFAAQVAALSPGARTMLLVAALDGGGDPRAVTEAAELLGAAPEALDEAEASGLISVGATISFRHPLVRAAAVDPARRRRAHAALAGVSTPDRAAHHLAEAAVGPDAAAAGALARSAERAEKRGAFAEAAAAHARAADLTPEAGLRAGRLTDAARAAWLGGRPGRAAGHLAEARALGGPGPELDRLQARAELTSGDAAEALRLLRAHIGPEASIELLADTVEAASVVGDVALAAEAGAFARYREPGFLRDVLTGTAAMAAGDTATGVALLRGTIAAAEDSEDAVRCLWASGAASSLGDAVTAARMVTRAARFARVAGLAGQLPIVLEFAATGERLAGRIADSEAIAEEGLALAREAGYVNSVAAHLANLAVIAALRGDEDACRSHAAEALAIALPHRIGLRAGTATYALGMLDLGLGRHAAAHDRFEALAASAPGVGHPMGTWRSSPDRVEAAVGAGDLEAARRILAGFERQSAPSPTAAPLLARCRALVAEGEEAIALLAAAGSTGSEFEDARTALLLGERLRRAQRPAEARAPLRRASEVFSRTGTVPWMERAHGELRASGESAERPEADALASLTPQELRIARLVGEGLTSKDVAARLFLSPRTVEYHLYKTYPKLGVTSRTELARLLGDQ